MLCTNCSSHVPPVVVFDIDGTLGDYHGHFLTFAEQYLQRGRNGVNYAGKERFRDWFCRVYGTSLDEFRTIKLAYRQGGLKRSMPMYSGMGNVVKNAKSLGAEIWIATTRPYLRLDNIDPDTRFWLGYNRLQYDGIIYGDNKYAQLAEQIDGSRVAAVVEDEQEQAAKAMDAFGLAPVIWRRNPYNQAVSPTTAGEGDPAKIEGRVHTNIVEWKELNHA